MPGVAELLAERVRMLEAVPVTGFGEKDAVTPLGRPEADRSTLPLSPYSYTTGMETSKELPGIMVTEEGLVFKVKDETERVMKGALSTCEPEVPVTDT